MIRGDFCNLNPKNSYVCPSSDCYRAAGLVTKGYLVQEPAFPSLYSQVLPHSRVKGLGLKFQNVSCMYLGVMASSKISSLECDSVAPVRHEGFWRKSRLLKIASGFWWSLLYEAL